MIVKYHILQISEYSSFMENFNFVTKNYDNAIKLNGAHI